jgi:capsular exopolysaccharide synthesis family protein
MDMVNKDQAADTHKSAPRGLADMIGVTALIQMLRRRQMLIAAVGVTAAVATFAFMMLRAPTYTATALLMISPPQQAQGVGAPQAQDSAVDSEIELLRSPALMNELASALGEGDAADASGGVVEDLSRAISVRRRDATFVIELEARSADPARAQLIANSYADVYLASQLNVRASSALRENSWLSRRLAELREDAQEKENAAEAFRAEAGLDAPAPPALEDQISNLQSQLQQAQADVAEREARQRRFQELREAESPLDAISTAFDSEALQALRERSTDVARRQADLEARYLPTHPALQAVYVERQDVDAEIERELQRMSVNLTDAVSSARARLQAIQEQMRSTVGDMAPPTTANASERLRELEREATASREIYDSFLQRYQQSADQTQLGAAGARLLSYASRPTSPSSPQLRVALALTLLIGLALGVGAGVIADLFDRSVKNADDLEQKVGYPAIASIPTISKRMMRQMPPAERHPSGYLVGRPMSAFTEALRVLRTVIVYSKLDFSVKVVAVTSALPDEGKTTISMCLARVAAMSGQRVCVVDCDLRKQSINDVIDIEADVGILQVLAGEAPWRSAIVQDPNSDAHVLPVAASGFTPRDVFGSEAMGRLIADLRAHYDLVILDCAPILAVAETRILVGQADTTVLVARAGRTPIGAMRSAVTHTEKAGGKVLGIALNYVLPRWQSYTDSLYFDESKSYYSIS